MTDFSEDVLDELRESVAELLVSHPAGVDVAMLQEFGWPDLYTENPQLAVGVLFGEMGRLSARVAAFEILVLQELGDGLPDGLRVSVLWPDAGARPALATGTGEVTGTVSAGWEIGDHLVAIDLGAATVTVLAADGARRDMVRGIDSSAGAARVSVRSAAAVITGHTFSSRVSTVVRRALAVQQLAMAREMLRVAVEHVSSRVQFGRPIGANQSVQHKLADVHVAVKAAAAAIDASWRDGRALAADVALGLAAEAADVAIRNTLQVCGGMGFTEEFALAPLVRRSLLLSDAFDQATLVTSVGQAVSNVVASGGRLARLGSFDTAGAPRSGE